jgi:hypothetical protein
MRIEDPVDDERPQQKDGRNERDHHKKLWPRPTTSPLYGRKKDNQGANSACKPHPSRAVALGPKGIEHYVRQAKSNDKRQQPASESQASHSE